MYCPVCKDNGFNEEMFLSGDILHRDIGLKKYDHGIFIDPDSNDVQEIYNSGEIVPRYYVCIQCDKIVIYNEGDK